jgi:two-component system alkaline phosphatase synthesis response regulator PhoP
MAKILVVDDEEHIVMILKDSLEFSGFQVVTAFNGEEALACVEEDHPDLIILDIGMPKLDGWEVCRRLKSGEKTKQIPVIILTAYAQTSDQRKGAQLGADRFITKPCDLTYLVEEINSLLAGKQKPAA